MRKKMVTVLLTLAVTASAMLGGCVEEPERLIRPEELELDVWAEGEYDKSGNQTKVVIHSYTGSVEWHEVEYDESGNVIKESVYQGVM